MAGACDVPYSTYDKPPAVVLGGEVSSGLGLQPGRSQKPSLPSLRVEGSCGRYRKSDTSRRNPSRRLAAASRSGCWTSSFKIWDFVDWCSEVHPSGFPSRVSRLPCKGMYVVGKCFPVLNTNQGLYNEREPTVRQHFEGKVRWPVGGLIPPACLIKSEGFHPSWVSSVDGGKGLVGVGVKLGRGLFGQRRSDDLVRASKGLESFSCWCQCSADGHMGLLIGD